MGACSSKDVVVTERLVLNGHIEKGPRGSFEKVKSDVQTQNYSNVCRKEIRLVLDRDFSIVAFKRRFDTFANKGLVFPS